MEFTYKHTEIYDWVGDEELRNSIINCIYEIENSKILFNKNNYESMVSKIFGWKSALERYKDAVLPDGTGVEIKKSGSSFIVDAIRYAEMYYGECEDGLHLFINFKKGNNHKITRIMIVPNWMIIKMVAPSKEIADAELTLYNKRKEMRQRLNSQAYLNPKTMIEEFNNM